MYATPVGLPLGPGRAVLPLPGLGSQGSLGAVGLLPTLKKLHEAIGLPE